jgi:group I intron endonuclease
MFVYLITNTINGKRYVGQTIAPLERRWQQHKKLSAAPYLHAAIKKYGEDNFTIEAICEPPTIELMNEFEAEYIERYRTLAPNGYNLTKGGVAPKHHEATRKKMSASHTGKPHPGAVYEWTPEMRERRRREYTGFNNPNSKLKPGQPEEIRKLYSTNEYTQTELAQMFSITQSRVSKIVLTSWGS